MKADWAIYGREHQFRRAPLPYGGQKGSGKMPLYTRRSPGRLRFIHKAPKVVNSPLGLACPHACLQTPVQQSCGNLENCCTSFHSPGFTKHWIDESRFLKENFRTQGCGRAEAEQRGAQAPAPRLRAAPCGTSAERLPPHLKFARFLLRNSLNLRKRSKTKSGRKKPQNQPTNSEPKATLRKLQIWQLIHLPADRHAHLACLYLYAWAWALCSVEAFSVFLNQREIKNRCTYRKENGKIPLSCGHLGYRSLETAALPASSSKTETGQIRIIEES